LELKSLIVKVSTPWQHRFLESQAESWNETHQFKFEVDNNCKECDFWIVWGGLKNSIDSERTYCPKENVIFLTDEVHDQKVYYQSFLNQFSAVITPRTDLDHCNILNSHELNTWHLHKSFIEVSEPGLIKKSKTISIVSSDLTDLPGHKKRFAFVNKIIGHFKDEIDVFGRGFRFIDDKWDALAPYKYSIAIENNSVPGYFTEKLTECYLAQTYPIYYGAPDIDKYFSLDSMLKIDIDDFQSSIYKIEKLIAEDGYESCQSSLVEEKYKYLNNYHLFPGLIKILKTRFSSYFESPSRRKSILIKSQNTFMPYYTYRKIFKTVKKVF
jgi:hypothetical protein